MPDHGSPAAAPRRLGTDGPPVSALGMGCWAIGGPYTELGRPGGWGAADDAESLRALRRAYDLGITFFDTADAYGCGHSERLVGRALGDVRDEVVIATKVGWQFVEADRAVIAQNGDPDYIRAACDESLRRLGTDHIDLYQFHLGDYDIARAEEVVAVFEELVEAGKVRAIGWSTDDPERAAVFARSRHCAAIQLSFNVFSGEADVIELCERRGLASIARTPLGMGFLTGKYTAGSTFPPDDVRQVFATGAGAEAAAAWVGQLDVVREILRSGGRTLAQGALAWLWARSATLIPIPGCRTVAQVEENAGALAHGPLTDEQMQRIAELLAGE